MNSSGTSSADTSYVYGRHDSHYISRIVKKVTPAGTILTAKVRCGYGGSLDFGLFPKVEYGRWINYENPRNGSRIHASGFAEAGNGSLCDSIGLAVQTELSRRKIKELDAYSFTLESGVP